MIGKKMMMTDPRYIPPSDREAAYILAKEAAHYSIWYEGAILEVVDHATFMDERDARQRSLIRRLHSSLSEAFTLLQGCAEHHRDDLYLEDDVFPRLRIVMLEARGVEATNE